VAVNESRRFRWSDNVLSDLDWTVAIGHIQEGVVVRVDVEQRGVYAPEDLLGKSTEEVEEMLQWDPTGQHPETYFQVWDGKQWTSRL
jgi:hypothetical protein